MLAHNRRLLTGAANLRFVVHCDGIHFRAHFIHRQVVYVFDSLAMHARFRTDLEGPLSVALPGHTFVYVDLTTQHDSIRWGREVNCGCWVLWAIEQWQAYHNSLMTDTFETHLHQAAAAVGVAHLRQATPHQTLRNQRLHNLEFLHTYKARLRRDLIPRTMCPRQEESERLGRLRFPPTRPGDYEGEGTREQHIALVGGHEVPEADEHMGGCL